MFFAFDLILAIFLAVSSPAAAQSGRTFYIDFASGSNSNNGTSTSTPWKSAPYMNHSTGCDGSGGPSYSHNAGDKFIFKGGVTWPNACFALIPSSGGVSSSYDYYGVCLSTDADSPCYGGTSWPSSGWTRPIFDAGGATMARASNNFIYTSSSSVGYLKIDNIEMKNQLGTASGDPCHDAAIEIISSTGASVLENLYLHGFWISTSVLGTNNGPSAGGGLCTYSGAAAQAINNFITGIDGGVVGQSAGQTPVLGCYYNLSPIQNSKCEYYADGVLGGASVHDSEFSHGSDAMQAYTAQHTNDIQDTWQVGMVVYNNLIHDSTAAQHVAVTPGGAVYNNVMWNLGNGTSYAMVDNGIDTSQNYPNATTYFFNNTIACSSVSCINVHLRGGTTTLGTVIIKNNVWVAPGSSTIYNPSNAPYTATKNYSMPSSEATTYGFTEANKYYPTSSDTNVVGAGENLSSLCSGNMTALCQDPRGAFWYGGSYASRPTSGSWDAQAYHYEPTSSSKPAAPTGLAATVQ